MYHIRTAESTHLHPVCWCGAAPERAVLGPWEHGMAEEPIWGHNAETEKVEIIGKHRYPAFCATIPMMTEWEWVKSNAKGHPAICQDCVDRILNVQLATPAFAANAEGQFFNDSLPF